MFFAGLPKDPTLGFKSSKWELFSLDISMLMVVCKCGPSDERLAERQTSEDRPVCAKIKCTFCAVQILQGIVSHIS